MGALQSKTRKSEIPKTNNELIYKLYQKLHLNLNYIKKWSEWNGYELPNQIKHGIESLYKQCSDKTNNEKQKKFLKDKYNEIMDYL